MDVSTLPFNKYLGLRVGRSDDKPVVILEPRPHHLNHVGTVHATVIYGIAEAASGNCLLARFPNLVDSFVAMLRHSSVKYRRPASSDGEIRAWGELSDAAATKFFGTLWSLTAGAAGAIGALGIIMAFNFGGKPVFVMPLVFGGAPVVNTLFTIAANGLWGEINALFIAGLLLVIAGAAIVLVFAPRGASPPKSKPEPKPVPVEPVLDAPPEEKAGGL